MSHTENVLLQPSTERNHVPPFAKLTDGLYLPAVEVAIEEAKANIAAIKANPEAPTFENTIEAMETAGELLDYVTSVFYNITYMAGSDELQAISDEIGPLAAAFSSDVTADKELFARIKTVYDQRDTLALTLEQKTLLENAYRDFVRGGALLPEDKQAELKKLNQEMSVLGPQFSHNKTKSLESYELWLTEPEDLKGLPPINVSMAKEAAKEKGKDDKWLITLDMPSFLPFMRYADNRALREEIWRAYNHVALEEPYDNIPLLNKIVASRHARAGLLGYQNHAAYVLELRMAKDSETVMRFLRNLIDAYFPAAKRDLEELRAFAKERDGLDALQPWDFGYYREKLRESRYAFNAEELRPYFQLEHVLEGTFTHFAQLFGITFKKSDTYPVWHKDVVAYDVTDSKSGGFLGTFYADFFPRTGKKAGAWQSSFRSQGLFRGNVERPVVAIVCNFTPSTADQPSLLTFDEVLTLFHEMGHAMHNLLAEGRYQSLTGTSVHWDFVELPSQLQENWCYEPETLALIAKHYQTGAPMPVELIEKLRRSKNFMVGWDGMTQAKYALLDMEWHMADPAQITDPYAFEDRILEPYRLFPKYPGLTSATFTHIFAGGYAAGYYSYKWAEVLDADAFEAFLSDGLYNLETAHRYRKEILEKGGIEPPEILYRAFRGRDPDPHALLRREGLASDKQKVA
jgi:peptidyl-dipeptidase Dcp